MKLSFCVWCKNTGEQCVTNELSRWSIQQQAVYLGELANARSRDQWLFPQLKFTCDTTITQLRFIGENLREFGAISELQVWRKDSPSSSHYSKQHHTSGTAAITTVQSNLFATSVAWEVREGDVFGVYQPDVWRSRYNFVMQTSGGEASYVLRNQWRAQDRFDTSSYDEVGYAYPLVNVDAGKILYSCWGNEM